MSDPMDVEPTNTSPPVAPENDELPPDTEPVFLEVGDGEEVVVDDSAPIEDEEEEAVVEDVASMEDNTIDEEEDGEKIVPQAEILCHRGPVYALSLTQKVRPVEWFLVVTNYLLFLTSKSPFFQHRSFPINSSLRPEVVMTPHLQLPLISPPLPSSPPPKSLAPTLSPWPTPPSPRTAASLRPATTLVRFRSGTVPSLPSLPTQPFLLRQEGKSSSLIELYLLDPQTASGSCGTP